MVHRLFPALILTVAALAAPRGAFAQGGDVTIFVGGAYPVHDDRLTLRPSVPSLPGVDVTVVGAPELRTNGGLVFGAALAFELGIVGIEGRLDATEVGFDFTGARYELTVPDFEELTGAVVIGNGRLTVDRLHLLSINARLRTPGPIGVVASGGLSYLPQVDITGSVPLALEAQGTPVPLPDPVVRLRAAPGASEHRFGVNGGAGLRVGGRRIALMGEVRVFYFRQYELRFTSLDPFFQFDNLLEELAPVRFNPVIVNAQAGLVFRF